MSETETATTHQFAGNNSQPKIIMRLTERQTSMIDKTERHEDAMSMDSGSRQGAQHTAHIIKLKQLLCASVQGGEEGGVSILVGVSSLGPQRGPRSGCSKLRAEKDDETYADWRTTRQPHAAMSTRPADSHLPPPRSGNEKREWHPTTTTTQLPTTARCIGVRVNARLGVEAHPR